MKKDYKYKSIKRDIKHLREVVALIDKMNSKAIDAALTSNNERLDASNHKYALLKEQQSTYATKNEMAVISKLVYIGLGAVLVLELVAKYLK